MLPLQDEITLFRVKPPLSSLALFRHGPYNDIVFIIRDKRAGTVRVPMEDTQSFLLNLCTEIRVPVGTIADGETSWTMDPDSFGFSVVVDSNGNLHRVEDL